MSTANAEAVTIKSKFGVCRLHLVFLLQIICDKTLAAFEFILAEPDELILREIAAIRLETVESTRVGINVVVDTICAVRSWYYPMTVRSLNQAKRNNQDLFSVWTAENVTERYQVSMFRFCWQMSRESGITVNTNRIE
jgi:hypothetical protein